MLLEDMLREQGIATAPADHRHSRPGWVNFDCPFCGQGTNKYHMGYNRRGAYFNCWQCGTKSTRWTLQQLFKGVDRNRVNELYEELDAEREFDTELAPARSSYCKSPPRMVPLSLSNQHCAYLESRGFDPTVIESVWKVMAIKLHSRLSWRLYIPIFYHDQLVSFTTRAIGQQVAPYISAKPEEEVLNHKHLLYGEDFCRNAVIVHEGPLDVWATGPGAVATFGLQYTTEQVVRIAQYPVRAICFDNEPEAQRQAKKLADDLSVYPGSTYNVCLAAKDSASATERERQQLRARFLGD